MNEIVKTAADPRARDILRNLTAGNILLVLVALALTWIAVRFLTRIFNALSGRSPRMRFLTKLVLPVVRILLWFSAMLFAAEVLAPSADAFLAALGSAAIAIGLGAQDLIKNLIGGFVIITDRPYQVGDRVMLGNAYGEVVHVGLRSTKIWNPDDTLVTIPNSEVLNATAYNSNTGTAEAMTSVDVYLPPDVDPELTLTIGREVVYTCPYLHIDRRSEVLLIDGFNQTPYLALRLKAYCFDHRYEPLMQSDLVRRAKLAFAEHGLLENWTDPKSAMAAESRSRLRPLDRREPGV
jgi:small-conductance mechanosensitive channel